MEPNTQGSVVISCDLLGKKQTRRYLFLQGSTVWISKQPTVLRDEAHIQHLTGRECYLVVSDVLDYNTFISIKLVLLADLI